MSAAVSIIIPARDEAANLGACLSAAAVSSAAEIVVVDDDSSDGTAQLVQSWAARHARIRMLRLGPLESDPECAGWAGKNRACWRGAQLASRPWLLFLDADARLMPGGLERALAWAQRDDLAALSLSPRQDCDSWAEAAVVPVVFTLLDRCYRHGPGGGPDGNSPAAANGQFFLFRRDAYFALGGHAAVAGWWLEDVALARRLQAAGLPFALLPGDGLVRARMYRDLWSLWRGWSKNAVPLFGPPLAWPPGPAARALAAPWLCAAAWALGTVARVGWLAGLGAVGLAACHADYARRLPRGQRRYTPWLLPGSALYIAIWCDGARLQRQGRLQWKGRPAPAVGGDNSL
ncbi:MAG: glycosyltransferase [Terriglobales bacterium]